MLARFTARVEPDIPANTEHMAIAWPLETEGRKRWAGSALLSAEGETLAVARALLVEPRVVRPTDFSVHSNSSPRSLRVFSHVDLYSNGLLARPSKGKWVLPTVSIMEHSVVDRIG